MTGKYPGTVKERGRTPYYNKPILMSDGLWDWHRGFLWHLGPRLRSRTWVVQGACMALLPGGGASDSGGYHDWNGALDYHLSDYIESEQEEWAWIARTLGGIAWPRGPQQGMEVHGHIAFPWDERPIDDGIFVQRNEYVAGGDGLLGGLPDYVRRPDPLILTPPKGATMSDVVDEIRKVIQEEVGKAVLSTEVPVTGGQPMPLAKHIQQIRFITDRTRELVRAGTDVDALATAIAAKLDVGTGASVADIETALRNVFADLGD